MHLPPERVQRHELVLRAAARAVVSLGGERRRGAGWVSITDTDRTDEEISWTAGDTTALLRTRGQA